MQCPKDKSLQEVFLEADRAISEFEDSRVLFTLFAIRAYESKKVKDVAALFDIEIRTVFRWAESFRKHGAEGLYDKPKGHKKVLLDGEFREQIAQWLDSGPFPLDGKTINWTLGKPGHYIDSEFGIVIKKSALSNTLRKMGCSLRKPGPTHVQSGQ
jgi:transposase